MPPKTEYTHLDSVENTPSDAIPSDPRQWPVILTMNELSQTDSTTLKSIIDWILDNFDGAIRGEGKLRNEMNMQKNVFLRRAMEYDEYELFVWSFEERFPTHQFDRLLVEAIVEMKKPNRNVRVVAEALSIHINPFH